MCALMLPLDIVLTHSSQSQAELPNTLHLQSSSTLGTGKASTNRERIEKQEDKETRRAIEGQATKRKRDGDKYDISYAEEADEDEDIDETEMSGNSRKLKPPTVTEVVVVGPESSVSVSQPSGVSKLLEVGSALQRNPDGSVVAPRIAKKKQGKNVMHFLCRSIHGANLVVSHRASPNGISKVTALRRCRWEKPPTLLSIALIQLTTKV